ncbi:MAG: hypothetical protein JF614_27655 [Acidobacteria bacterium]|nr:hypothetical protein [Acidobacteriota bacterium]
MSETFWSGVDDNYHPYGSDGFQETWYIPRDALSGTSAFSRAFNPSNSDHIDLPGTAGGSGYSFEFQHGNPWTTQKPGTLPITRYIRFSPNFDHRTSLFASPAPGYSPTPAGYQVDAIFSTSTGTPLYGFQRFNNCLARNAVSLYPNPITYQNSLNNGTLQIDFNRVWGNAIGRITYLPRGQQVVNSDDIGSLVQAALFRGTSLDDAGTCCRDNPTEAGGVDVAWYANTLRWTGSPVLSVSSSSGPGSSALTTVLKPLNFTTDLRATSPSGGGSTDPFSPLLWRGTFQKTTTLGYRVGSQTLPNVVRIQSDAMLDTDAPSAMDGAYNMHNAFFFLGVSVSFFDVVNLQNGSKTTVSNRTGTILAGTLHDTNSATVASTADRALAIGVFRLDQAASLIELDFNHDSTSNSLTFGSFSNHVLNRSAYETENMVIAVGPTDAVETQLRAVYCQQTGRCTAPVVNVVSATYGGNCGAAAGNVTSQLATACNGRSSCNYTVDYRLLGDPAPGCAKNYVARWQCGTNTTTFIATAAAEAGFGSVVTLTCN